MGGVESVITETAKKAVETPKSAIAEGAKVKDAAEIGNAAKSSLLEPNIEAIKNRTLDAIVEENRNANSIESAKESSEGKDAIEGHKLRELTDEEKDILKAAGLTDANIEKCLIDEEGKIYLNCRNQGLEGSVHPETGVPYVRRIVVIQGIIIEGVFPEFEGIVSYQLPEDMLKATEAEQFKYLNNKLYEEIKNNPELRAQFTDQQIKILESGKNPPGFTWHHNEESGKMQLVQTATHSKSGHTGGDSIWCGR